jgi:beta-lactamase regulating signal transducer with metallopeptidase domain
MAALVPALALALLHFLWQGALVGLLAWTALALLRDARPQARYAVSCLALLACVLLPACTLLHAFWQQADATGLARIAFVGGGPVESIAAIGPDTLLPAPSDAALSWIVAAWAAGVATLSLRMACGLLWLRRLRRDAEGDTCDRWQVVLDGLAPRLRIARRVELRLVREGDSPATAGWWRPVVLLPLAVAARMPAELVEALLAHELAHVRRHDYLVNLLQSAAEALLFHHPVVWWLSHRIRIERELVADDLAATALGDRRRLALALSELDRHAAHHAPSRTPSIPLPQFAPAAHGGHLMPRIRQLLRPERRAAGATVLSLAGLPLVGLALAGAAFYAQAQLAPSQATAPPPPPSASARPLPAPAARPGARVLPAPAPRPAAGSPDVEGDDRSAYALVRADRDGISLSGDLDDVDEVRAARRAIDGDFLWFRRDGEAWVVRDADTLARVRAAWAGTDALGERMQGLEARMQPHSKAMEALGERMEALAEDNAFESPEGRAAIEAMEALGDEIGELAERQVELAMRMEGADGADETRLDQERAALEREQERMHARMERHQRELEVLNGRMARQHAPMEALAREMEAASEPMEAIGREMEALGERIEEAAGLADAQTRRLIEEAVRTGRAQPAPARQ